jgi:RNA polymerase sigma factor (sigma-70 family)
MFFEITGFVEKYLSNRLVIKLLLLYLSLMKDIKSIIEGCVKCERKSQQELYDKYSRDLLRVCFRYSKDSQEAEDILQESFIRIFANIKNFAYKGSFEGWLKRIVVNTALTSYHKNINHSNHLSIEDYMVVESGCSLESDFLLSELIHEILNGLPNGYRTVFNLYAIDGYKHWEIGEILGIDGNTSKSQYCRAKAVIRNRLKNTV